MVIALSEFPDGRYESVHVTYANALCGKGAASNQARITAIKWNGLVAVNVLTLRNYDGDVCYYEKAYMFKPDGELVHGIRLHRNEYHLEQFRITSGGYGYEQLKLAPHVDLSFIDHLVKAMKNAVPTLLKIPKWSIDIYQRPSLYGIPLPDRVKLLSKHEHYLPMQTRPVYRAHVTAPAYADYIAYKTI